MSTWAAFTRDLSKTINSHGIDNYLAWPDYILADLIVRELKSLHMAGMQLGAHYGEEPPESVSDSRG